PVANLTINGPGTDRLTITTNLQGRIFLFNNLFTPNPPTVSINNLTLAAGKEPVQGGGCIQERNLILKLDNLVIKNCVAGGPGGGIYNIDGGQLYINNSTITGNKANSGGGISSAGFFASTNITNSTISGNIVDGSGGGIANVSSAATTITNT